MRPPDRPDANAGVRTAFVAYTIWGLLTLYWKQLADFDAFELIGWRVLAAAVVMGVVISLRRSWPKVLAALRSRPVLARITIAALLLTCNWTAYVYAVVNDRVIETALGYFIAPLGTMTMGILAFGERLTRSRRLAMALAAAAVVELTLSYGQVPVVALVIAVSWSCYGYCKRHIPLSAVDGFAAESLVLAGPAAILVSVFAGRTGGIPAEASAGEFALVSLAGVATAIPLVMFAYAAVRVPFTILGPLNYLVPIINFVLGWALFDEPMPWSRVVGFALVWAALVIVSVDQLRSSTAARRAPATAVAAAVGSPAS